MDVKLSCILNCISFTLSLASIVYIEYKKAIMCDNSQVSFDQIFTIMEKFKNIK